MASGRIAKVIVCCVVTQPHKHASWAPKNNKAYQGGAQSSSPNHWYKMRYATRWHGRSLDLVLVGLVIFSLTLALCLPSQQHHRAGNFKLWPCVPCASIFLRLATSVPG